jgi:guanylate kinase
MADKGLLLVLSGPSGVGKGNCKKCYCGEQGLSI